MTTQPDDIDALFNAPAPAAAPAPAPEASVFPGLGAGHAGIDGRRQSRVKVPQWPGRVQLPNGRVVEVRVRDLSDDGVGLVTEVGMPAQTILNFAMGVPSMDGLPGVTPLSGTVRTTYMVVSGPDLCCGVMWISLPDSSRELLSRWIAKLRR